MDRKLPVSKTLKRIAKIGRDLAEILPAEKMAEFNIPDADFRATLKQGKIEARIVELASAVANAKFAEKSYSNFHIWDVFHYTYTAAEARTFEPVYSALMGQFGNCMSMASECTAELRAALEAEGPEYAIMWIEYSFHALTVPLGGLSKLQHDSSLKYAYVASGKARLLTEWRPDEPYSTLRRLRIDEQTDYNDPYTDLKDGLAGAIEHLAYPSVNYHVRAELPSRRRMFLKQIWEQKPTDPAIYSVKLAAGPGFVVQTCGVRMDFFKQKIAVDWIPYVDFLQRPENAELLLRMHECHGLKVPEQGDSFAKFRISIYPDPDINADGGQDPNPLDDEDCVKRVRCMEELCRELGMSKGELERIVIIMRETCEEWKYNWMGAHAMKQAREKEEQEKQARKQQAREKQAIAKQDQQAQRPGKKEGSTGKAPAPQIAKQ